MKYLVQPTSPATPATEIDANGVDLGHNGELRFTRSSSGAVAVFAPGSWQSYWAVYEVSLASSTPQQYWDALVAGEAPAPATDKPAATADREVEPIKSSSEHRRDAVHARQNLASENFSFLTDDAMRRVAYFLKAALTVIAEDRRP